MSFFDNWIPNTPLYKLLGYIAYGLTKRALNAPPKCHKCQSTMLPQADSEYLFLLPLWDNESHDDSQEYFLQHMHPIQSEKDIPTGKRACRISVFFCQSCNQRIVRIDDFLKVRAEKVVYGQYIYEYASFETLLSQNTPEKSDSQPQ